MNTHNYKYVIVDPSGLTPPQSCRSLADCHFACGQLEKYSPQIRFKIYSRKSYEALLNEAKEDEERAKNLPRQILMTHDPLEPFDIDRPFSTPKYVPKSENKKAKCVNCEHSGINVSFGCFCHKWSRITGWQIRLPSRWFSCVHFTPRVPREEPKKNK